MPFFWFVYLYINSRILYLFVVPFLWLYAALGMIIDENLKHHNSIAQPKFPEEKKSWHLKQYKQERIMKWPLKTA